MNQEVRHATEIISDLIDSINYFYKAISGVSYVDPKEFYKRIRENDEMFRLMIDNILKKSTVENIFGIYQDVYEILIPYFKEELAIDNLTFVIKDSLEEDHTLMLKVYIDETYYGDFNPINGVYTLPNIPRMKEIEQRILEISPKATEMDAELLELAHKIKSPKKFFSNDIAFRLAYTVDKKGVMDRLKKDFDSMYAERYKMGSEVSSLTAEYEQYEAEISDNRYYDEKLTTRLFERLGVYIENELILNDETEKNNLNKINALYTQTNAEENTGE